MYTFYNLKISDFPENKEYCCCLVAKLCPTSVTPWTVAHQAHLSVGFLGQEYGSGLPFPSQADLPDPGNGPRSPELAGGFFTTDPPWKPKEYIIS